MTIYVIAQLKFTRRAAYDRYQAGFASVFSKYDGTVLAADSGPRVLEGHWPRDKVVLLSFPNESAFEKWSASPEYIALAKDRKTGADAIVLLVQGLSDSER